MTTIFHNRARIQEMVEQEKADISKLRRHVPVAIISEIIRARRRGLDVERISFEFNVDPDVIVKLGDQFALPVDNGEGFVLPYLIMLIQGEWPTK